METSVRPTHPPSLAVRRIAFLAAFLAPVVALRAQTGRIATPIDPSRTVLLRGSVRPGIPPQNDQGRVEPDFPLAGMTLYLKQSPSQQADLQQLLLDLQSPVSGQYHRWLTPEQYAERFGCTRSEIDAIAEWLRSAGFSVGKVARSRTWIVFNGTGQQVADAFHTEIHRYESRGKMHFANATPPSVPEALEDVVMGIDGLDDFSPEPEPARQPAVTPNATSFSGVHTLAPDDIATIYDIAPLYQAGITGAGQTIAVAGSSEFGASALADVAAFRAQFNLPPNVPRPVLDTDYPDPGVNSNTINEAHLDIEWAGAVARNATIVFVYSGTFVHAVQYAIDNNLAQVVTESANLGCEASNSTANLNFYRALAQQANVQGVTWVNSGGDSGAAACDSNGEPIPAVGGLSVRFPASIPEVTAVGGTEFNEQGGSYWATSNTANGASAISYIPEMVWNDTAADGALWAGGGGASGYFLKPDWQNGPGVPNDGMRDMPDVALAASFNHDGYDVYRNGGSVTTGGTSASAPVFAGILALIDQYLLIDNSQTQSGLGNVNPTLYRLAQTGTGVFHDITTGNNIVPCLTGSPNCVNGSMGFSAGPGYDQASGLGSLDVANLVAQFSSQFPPVFCTYSLSFGGQAFPVAGGTGSVNVTTAAGCPWTASSTLSWVTLISGASGVGNGTVTYQVAANTGGAQTGSLAVAGLAFTVEQASATVTGLVSGGSMAQLASGGLWNTSITLVNTSASAAEMVLNFFDDNGNPLLLPLTFPQTSAFTAAAPLLASTLDRTIAAGAELVIQTVGTPSQTTVEGWGQLQANGNVGGSAVFAFTTSPSAVTQEAVVPLETANPSAFVLPFDNTGGYTTGVALANLSNQAATIPVVLRDATGASLGAAAPIQLAAHAHTSFTLQNNYPALAGKYGAMELDTPAGGQIGALGIRAAPDDAITTIPALATGAVSNGSMAQVVSGGLWNSTITLVNTSTTAAQVTLNFYDDNGNALPLPLIYPLTGSTTPQTASTLTQTIGADAQLVLATAGTTSQATTEGWAALTATGGNVGGSAVFAFTAGVGLQEAVVPVETRNPSAFVLPFDNTGGYTTGIALANLTNQAASIPVVLRDDTGASLGTAAPIALAANAHNSFTLANTYPAIAGKRGTIELDTPAGGQIGALGIRATPQDAITTVPVLAK
jgi:hypothetical protein